MLSAVGATVLFNYFFTPPLHSFAVVEPHHLLALGLLLLAAVLVALAVDNAARRGQQAVRARAEAALLTDFAITVMTEPDPLRLLLEKVREAFGATSVAPPTSAPAAAFAATAPARVAAVRCRGWQAPRRTGRRALELGHRSRAGNPRRPC